MTPDREPARQVAIRYPDDMLAEVDRLATTEQRTRSQMIRVLLGEALTARAQRAQVAATAQQLTEQAWDAAAPARPLAGTEHPHFDFTSASPAPPAPDQAEGITRAKARALDPDAQQRLRESRASAVAPVAAPSLSHPFHPQPGNALKCEECGGKSGDHR